MGARFDDCLVIRMKYTNDGSEIRVGDRVVVEGHVPGIVGKGKSGGVRVIYYFYDRETDLRVIDLWKE